MLCERVDTVGLEAPGNIDGFIAALEEAADKRFQVKTVSAVRQ
jgi:hypothetical protein